MDHGIVGLTCDRLAVSGGWGEAHCPGAYPRRELVPVVVEVVVLVPGSIPERIQYATVDDWRMDCPWWIVLWIIL